MTKAELLTTDVAFTWHRWFISSEYLMFGWNLCLKSSTKRYKNNNNNNNNSIKHGSKGSKYRAKQSHIKLVYPWIDKIPEMSFEIHRPAVIFLMMSFIRVILCALNTRLSLNLGLVYSSYNLNDWWNNRWGENIICKSYSKVR